VTEDTLACAVFGIICGTLASFLIAFSIPPLTAYVGLLMLGNGIVLFGIFAGIAHALRAWQRRKRAHRAFERFWTTKT
jgi:Na+/H+-dicarboxylate symporter